MTTGSTVVLGEYERRQIPASAPTESDLRLSNDLAGTGQGDGNRLDVRWLANGNVEIGASSWVGVARFSDLEVHVVPKFVGGPLRVLRMLEYTSGVDILRRLPMNRPLPVDGTDLFDLVCLLLVEETTALLRDGLLHDYRTTVDDIPVLRGRLRYREQVLRRYGQLDRLDCSFDEYDADIAENQLITAALLTAHGRVRATRLRFAVTRQAGILNSACEPHTTDPSWYERTIRYDRRNARYRPAHELAKFVLRHAGFHDLFDTSTGARVGAFMINMNTLFEAFIRKLLRDALAGTELGVTAPSTVRAVIRDEDTDRNYSSIRPDVLLNLPAGWRIPIDVKYKLYETRKLSTADIYQTFTYALALGEPGQQPRAGIIYPAMTFTKRPNLTIRPVNGPVAARVNAVGIDVPRTLEELRGPNRDDLLHTVRGLIAHLGGLDLVASEPAPSKTKVGA